MTGRSARALPCAWEAAEKLVTFTLRSNFFFHLSLWNWVAPSVKYYGRACSVSATVQMTRQGKWFLCRWGRDTALDVACTCPAKMQFETMHAHSAQKGGGTLPLFYFIHVRLRGGDGCGCEVMKGMTWKWGAVCCLWMKSSVKHRRVFFFIVIKTLL